MEDVFTVFSGDSSAVSQCVAHVNTESGVHHFLAEEALVEIRCLTWDYRKHSLSILYYIILSYIYIYINIFKMNVCMYVNS